MNSKEQDFDFMLKEYEMLYGKFQMHYDAVEKSIRTYLIIVAALLSSLGLFYPEDNIENFNLFRLNTSILLMLFVVTLIGVFTFLNVVEHRLLIIAYVRSLNLNRKWFSDNANDKKISEYFFWKANISKPEYFSKDRNFFWESLSISLMVGTFLALLIVNILNKIWSLNLMLLLIISAVLAIVTVILLVLFYKKKGERNERSDENNQSPHAFN